MDVKRTVMIPVAVAVVFLILNQAFDSVFNAYFQTLIIYSGINIILAVSLNLVNGFTGQFSIGHAGFMATGAYFSAWLTMTFPHWAGPIIEINFLLNTIAGGLLAGVA